MNHPLHSATKPQAIRPGVVAETWLDYCQGWFDANTAYITQDGGALVSNWANRAPPDGVTRDLSQSTAAQQPLWVDAVINGYPVVRFDGAATNPDNLKNTVYPIPGWPVHYYFVGQSISTQTYATIIEPASARGTTELHTNYNGNLWAMSNINTNIAKSGNGVPVVVHAAFIPGACQLRVNGSLSAKVNLDLGTATGIMLGALYGPANGANWDIAELIILYGNFPDAVDSVLMSWLANKYAITI